jgi:hypothetical protein
MKIPITCTKNNLRMDKKCSEAQHGREKGRTKDQTWHPKRKSTVRPRRKKPSTRRAAATHHGCLLARMSEKDREKEREQPSLGPGNLSVETLTKSRRTFKATSMLVKSSLSPVSKLVHTFDLFDSKKILFRHAMTVFLQSWSRLTLSQHKGELSWAARKEDKEKSHCQGQSKRTSIYLHLGKRSGIQEAGVPVASVPRYSDTGSQCWPEASVGGCSRPAL